MIKGLITIAIVLGLYWLGKTVYTEYQAKEKKTKDAEIAAQQGLGADGLSGLPPQFEPSLQAAQSQGAAALKAWLDRYRSHVRDPKLGSIELDYATMLARQNPAEAKRIYQGVRRRTPTNSPLYPRIKKLEATFGN